MPSPSVTHTFSNSTTADATQVNTNFTDLINGASDGTKDYSINALTCAGAATLNGNVTLGNASSDTLTITASLASSIAIGTTNSYDIGSATVGLRSVYFAASDSSARSARLLAGAVSASYSITLPTAAPASADSVMLFTTGGVASFVNRSTGTTASKTAAYTATLADDVILCDATSAAFTVTLPAAASSTGKILTIKKTDSSANAVTLDGNSSETIDGATTKKLATRYSGMKIICDGSNWHILEEYVGNSSVQVDQGNGHGSTNTAIRRFSGTATTAGGDITYADSSTNGATFTINADGRYSIAYTDRFGGGAGDLGISVNSAQLTTSIASITAANRVISTQNAIQSAGSGAFASVAGTFYFSAGDVIRAHTDGTLNSTDVRVKFYIQRVA